MTDGVASGTEAGMGRPAVAGPIGRFAARTALDDVPDEVVRFARLLLLDTLGALLGGLRYPAVRRLGSSLGVAAVGRAPFGFLMTLGTASTWLDADSGGSFHPQGHRLPPVPTAHPAPHSLPVLLRAAAADRVDDRRLLEVFLVANEVGMRSGVASSLRPGLHPHGVHGPAAAALAAGMLGGAAEDELGAAFLLGSALPMAATLAVPMRGGTVRNAWTGLGCYYGAAAAQRALQGVRGDERLYSELFDAAVCTDLSDGELHGDLGTRWQLASSYLKPYACARWIHPALDAVQKALQGSGVRGNDVESVEVETFAFAASLTAVDIGSDMQARFSLPYCVATLLTDGDLHAGSYLPEGLAREPVARLARRVVVREEPAYSAGLPQERPTRVQVRTMDGCVHEAEVRNARGNPSDPLSRTEVENKFRRNVDDTVTPELVDDVIMSLLDDAVPGDASLARLTVAILTGFGSPRVTPRSSRRHSAIAEDA